MDRFFLYFILVGRYSNLTGSCCSEVDVVLKLFGKDLDRLLLTGGR